MDTFDTAYANYLKLLAKLDKTDDIAEKNQIFRQLTQLLCELEQGLKNKALPGCREELAYWL
ncbi:hypothetical protein M1B72_06370 [Geomonas paludis]|uniref:Uncharacterized protein n=3 Tax=Geomonas TaxID=2651583 RepID=A0A6V8MYC7_9BACT|nr:MULTISPECIES: hypothetical protein [Geomonas]MBJ6749351.1 hypothetical protein [Geomonas anaerohicana]QWV92209.1 hypothetical protein KP004_13385 [Geomonas oryzisoli]UPU37325.1 hypothetical protein M1B72_06370 [Geomonas paludis]GFO65226.1 hypothetical protein GMPD_31450 [Geomonas paludis]